MPRRCWLGALLVIVGAALLAYSLAVLWRPLYVTLTDLALARKALPIAAMLIVGGGFLWRASQRC